MSRYQIPSGSVKSKPFQVYLWFYLTNLSELAKHKHCSTSLGPEVVLGRMLSGYEATPDRSQLLQQRSHCIFGGSAISLVLFVLQSFYLYAAL